MSQNEREDHIDMTDINNIATHRYRFWYLFSSTGVVLETEMSVPGHFGNAEADAIARESWREAVMRLVGRAAHPDMTPHNPRRGFSASMAQAAADGARFRVWRPGEQKQD